MESSDPECYAFNLQTPVYSEDYYKDLCLSKGTCATGAYSLPCLVSDDAVIDSLQFCLWTPKGCLFAFGGLCEDLGGDFVRFTTKSDCEGMGDICRETSTMPTGGLFTRDRYTIPEGFSLKNNTECSACGFKHESYFKWQTSEWVASRAWGSGSYGKTSIERPIWEPFVSKEKWQIVLEEARAIRLGAIATTELYCM
eukprot:TRINITY_DN1008_c0_g1_i3.p1 TRINITY_DN1008_c0_g1~~TRINITY_DN1008_c0_g1_i3.p1  ORF type:complete len:197 (-),score=28.66 TRINITY_DN1008_c0_g1_i3:39-629(-)